jgi:DNA-binding transcriptional LysR family regulator
LTEAGERFIATVGPALAAMEDSIERLRAREGDVTGVLRINAPRLALPMALTPVLAAMARRFPALTVEITSDESLVDIVAAGYDAGVRLGEMIAQDMVTVRLTPAFEAIVVASPGYLRERPAPRAIADLAAHNCIGYRLLSSGAPYDWELRDGDREVAVTVQGSARVSDPMSARDLARAGVGIAYLFEPLVREDLAAGRLIRVLREAKIEEPGLFLYFPRRVAQAPKLRAFIDVAKAVLA